MKLKGYYVYKVVFNDQLLYVGKGNALRYKHAINGRSHCYELNELYFRNKLLGEELPIIEIVKDGLDSEQAGILEASLIRQDNPLYNKLGGAKLERVYSLSLRERILLEKLKEFELNGSIRPTHRELANKCGFSKSTVQRALSNLEGCGMISRDYDKDGVPVEYTIIN